jgi:Tfp pilus assembly protein PilF
VEIVSAAFRYEENDIATWTPCGELLPHAFATTDHAEERGVSLEATGNLLNEAGFFVRNRADFQTARTMAKRAVAIGEETLGPVHPELATRVNNLGAVLYELGEREKAKSCFERALAIDERAFGPEHPNVAEDVNNLGSVFWRNGDHAEAMKCYDRALAIDEKEFGTDHPKVAIRVNNLGTVLYRLGESEKAKRCFDRALAIDEKVFGPEHPKVANRVNNLGALLVKMGDLTGAKAHLERAVHIFARLLGEEHPYTRGARGNLEAVERALREQNQEYSNAECGMRNGEGRGGVLTRIPACAAETDRWVGYYSPPFKWWASFCRPRTGRTVDQRAGFSMIVGLASQRGRFEAHHLHWWANVVLDSRLRGNDELMDRASSVGARA